MQKQTDNSLVHAIGMMSGTSLDAMDFAYIVTDGLGKVIRNVSASYEYDEAFREEMRACFGNKQGMADPYVAAVARKLTEKHAEALKLFLAQNNLSADSIDVVGFHGQTIYHAPHDGVTIQIGDGALLAALTGIDVVCDFRVADVKAGGQGAPLVPLYHRALAAELSKPLAIINIGGVTNVTWIKGEGDDEILAFDMGTGNALLDDWVHQHTGKAYDKDGLLALAGKADIELVEAVLEHPFFNTRPPKSLDRDIFKKYVPQISGKREENKETLDEIVSKLSLNDGAATLTYLTVASIVKGLSFLPEKPQIIYLTGGGRHNETMKLWLNKVSGIKVGSVDDLGWDGNAMEAEAFAYLAVRALRHLPLSLPKTTGAAQPICGGVYFGSKVPTFKVGVEPLLDLTL